jgi:hypothetical protein
VIITTGRIRRTLVNQINLLIDSPRSIEASRLAPVKAESIFLRRASDYFGTSRGSSSTTSPTPHVRVPWHVVRLVTRLVVDYFNYAARPGASAHRAARRRLLHLSRALGCLGTSRDSSHGSSSTTSTTLRVRVPRQVARLVTRLVIDYFASRKLVIHYFAYVARPGASARRADRHAARRRLLHLRRASSCFDMSRCWSSTTSPTRRLVVDNFAYAARLGASTCRAAHHAARRRLLRLAQAHR